MNFDTRERLAAASSRLNWKSVRMLSHRLVVKMSCLSIRSLGSARVHLKPWFRLPTMLNQGHDMFLAPVLK